MGRVILFAEDRSRTVSFTTANKCLDLDYYQI